MKITSKEKNLLIVLLIVALAYLTMTYAITPLQGRNKELKDEKAIADTKMENLNNSPMFEEQLDRSIEEQYTIITGIASKYYNTTPQEEVILLVNDLFEVEEMNIESMGFSESEVFTVGTVDFLKNTIDISFNGDYQVLLNVLDTVWKFPKKIQVGQVSFSAVEMLDAEGNVITTGVVNAPIVAEEAPVGTEVPVTETVINETLVGAEVQEEPKTGISGSISIDLINVMVESGVVDNLYTWYVDDLYSKQNPLIPYEKKNATIRYIFTGDGASLFNFDRFNKFTDISGHWMEEEIQAFLESGYIYMNNYNTFGPDLPISRGEFVILLDSVFEWTGEEASDIDITTFKDYETLGNLDDAYAKAIQRGVQRGYIMGYANNTLALAAPITYGEVELVMRRIQGNDSFKWRDVAESITLNESVTSPRWNDLNATTTKAEAVYLLTYFK